MPRGPKGERRPVDVIDGAHKVFQIGIGEDADEILSGRRHSGFAGVTARANTFSSADLKTIAKKMASVRWDKDKGAK